MMEENLCAVLFSVLCLSADGLERCQSRSACFPGGIVPDDVPEGTHYMHCCLHKNTSMNYEKAADGTENCTCVPDFTLEGKIQKWADSTKDYGRMCNRGAANCADSKSSTTTNYKFLDCCWPEVSSKITTFDGDKEEYIGCRCNAAIPSPDPTAYTVPLTSLYSSTGEVCSYDKGCEDRPALKCTSPGVTFCCYGSRGIVTANDGDSLTRCTCTNQVYGEMCKSTSVPIEQTKLPCLRDCSNRDDDDVCRDSGGNERCCEHNMAVSARQHNGNFTDCTCTTDRFNYCGFTAPACLTDCSNRDDDDVCRDSGGNERCCEHNMAVSARQHNGNFTDCTCTTDRINYCGVTALACLTDCNNRDDDDVCRDSGGNKRCCDHNMAVSAKQHNGYFTDCTCTTDRFNYCGVTAPACLRDCSNRDDYDVCRDSWGNERCCEHNMAVSASQHNGNFTDCTCTTDTVKSCDVSSTAVSSYLQSLGQLLGQLLVMLVPIAVVEQCYRIS